MTDGKILISGTGRAGTSLLVAILSDLGLDTGFAPGVRIDPASNAGLERGMLRPDAPRIVKVPGQLFALGDVLDRGVVDVEHVIVPVRDLAVASASRVRVAGYGRRQGARGGLAGTWRPGHQERVLAEAFYSFVHALVHFDVPFTMIDFPRFAGDWEYLHAKLGFLAPEIPAAEWERVVTARYQPQLVHEQALTRAERTRVVLGTPVALVSRAARGLSRRTGSNSGGRA